MTSDAPEPRYERFAGPFRTDPLPLHYPAPPMCQRGLHGGIARLTGAFVRVGHAAWFAEAARRELEG